MKGFFDRLPPAPQSPASEDAVGRATLRYNAAFAQYQSMLDQNSELSLRGGTPSKQAQLDEEEAFEELDGARHALLSAAAEAYPTIH